jgi:hypothetical protein
MPTTKSALPPVGEEVRYSASDAAEFSRQGAYMTALPPDEFCHLPKIEDQPPPIRQYSTIESKAAEGKTTHPNPEAVESRAASNRHSLGFRVKLMLFN